jgi:hypothetical protein
MSAKLNDFNHIHWSDPLPENKPAARARLGARGRYRRIEEANGTAILRDAECPYTPRFAGKMSRLSIEMPR